MQSQNPQNSADGTMKPKTYVKIYQIGKSSMFFTMVFWFIYTIAYQIIDGWHIAPVSRSEEILDAIASIGFNISFAMMFIPMIFKMDELLEENVNN